MRPHGRPIGVVRRFVRTFGIAAFVARYLPAVMARRPYVVVHSMNGAGPITVRPETSDVDLYNRILRRRSLELGWVRPPETIVDAGAHIGLASIYYARCFPTARIIAIEPEPTNFGLLVRNVRAYPSITAVQGALWHEAGMLDVSNPSTDVIGEISVPSSRRTARYRVWEPPHRDAVVGRARAFTMTDLMERYAIDTIDLLKIDIEGAELELFKDARAWIGRVNVIVAELHDRFRPGCALVFHRATRSLGPVRRSGEHVIVSRPGWVVPVSGVPAEPPR